MSHIKKILLYLFGVILLIFGNRDILAKISSKENLDAKNRIKPQKTKLIPVSAPKDSLQQDTLKSQKPKTEKEISKPILARKEENHKKTVVEEKGVKPEEATKSEVVVGGVKKEKEEGTMKEAPKTKIEKEEPEKASGTE
jgi:hypothetical protein